MKRQTLVLALLTVLFLSVLGAFIIPSLLRQPVDHTTMGSSTTSPAQAGVGPISTTTAVVAPSSSPEGSTNAEARARAIMGQNFFGIEEAISYFGVHPSPADRAALSEIPWSEQTLEEVKDTHILVAVFPVSILDMKTMHPNKFNSDRYTRDSQYEDTEAFLRNKGAAPSWHLVKREAVKDSLSKTWSQEQTLLGPQEQVPTARVRTYALLGVFLATGKWPFEPYAYTSIARCLDVASNGGHVTVGIFEGIFIRLGWDASAIKGLGLASERKPE